MDLELQGNPWRLQSLKSTQVYPGTYRYLKGTEVNEVTYDFAIVTRQRSLTTKEMNSNRSIDVAMDSSKAVEEELIEKLVASGLDVDVLEGDFSRVEANGQETSQYFILLVRGNEAVLAFYGQELKFQTWLRRGKSREVEAVVHTSPLVTPAERIQVIDHIIRETAKITHAHPRVQAIFPVHDPATNRYFLKTFLGTQKLAFLAGNALDKVRAHFGERVGYYFAFMDFYNKALVPIAVLGLVLTCLRRVVGTPTYMRVLVAWALLISVCWSYGFLKAWSRRTHALNHKWVQRIETQSIVYRNPNFHGYASVDPVTGFPDQWYPRWKRYPKYLVVVCFMMVQISIMMAIIAIWITAFEVLKVRYPESHLFSVQWFYILGGGVLYGLFVDILQWHVIVTKAARMFTEWENWKTIEQFETSLVRKLFFMDFLNYYTWFILLAFVYVIPGAGDTITNGLNTLLWHDPSNCCFGPYLSRSGSYCNACPAPWNARGEHEARCIPCRGWVTFDIHHLDLETLFLTPIIITQLLNLLLAVAVPWIHRIHYEQRLRGMERKVQTKVKAQGQRPLLADRTYQLHSTEATTMQQSPNRASLLEKSERDVEKSERDVALVNAKARALLFEGAQDKYDPYDDYHHLIVQFGFVVMFSTLWPLMPAACMVVNALKTRGDGFRLCRTNRRPLPRNAHGIGEWYPMLHFVALTGVVINIGLVFISTGAVEFFSPVCAAQLASALGHDFSHFRFGPDFACFSLTTRLFMIFMTEHCLVLVIWVFWTRVPSVPANVQLELRRQDVAFRSKLYQQASKEASDSTLEAMASVVSGPSTPVADSQRSEFAGSKEEKEPLLATQRCAHA